MKIACIGNMNNCMLPIARTLADDGHTVTLFLLDEYEHFLPEADYFEPVQNITITYLGWNHQNFHTITKKKVRELFEAFAYFIGTDYAPAILLKARMTVDLYFPAGGDLFDYPYRKLQRTKWLPAIFQIEAWRCAKYQKIGLGLVGCVSMDAANEDFEKYLKLLKMDRKERIPALPFLYMKQYTASYFEKSAHYKMISDLRKNNDFLIIQHCRQSWTCDKSDLHYKANELLLEGFGAFKKEYPNVNAVLLLLKYGFDVEASRELIRSLGIEENVVWLPKMFRKDLMAVISQCDAGVGELGRSWLSYGAVYETLAMKLPFIGNRKDSDYLPKMPVLYPMYHAETSRQVEQRLYEIYSDRETARATAEKAYGWFLEYAIHGSVNSVNNMIRKGSALPSISVMNALKLFCIDSATLFVVLLNKVYLKFNKLAGIR